MKNCAVTRLGWIFPEPVPTTPVLRQNKIGALWDGIADGDDVSQTRRSAVHRIDPPALNGVGNQTNGRRHRTRGLAARTLHLETNPPIAQRKSPRTVRARLREHPLPCHTPGSDRSSAPESSHVA